MIRKSLIFVLFALMLASCSFQHILSEEEYNALDKATLDFDIDWSALDEKPKGCTLYFFPCEENPIDSTIYHYSFNNVDHVRVYLPDQDYSVICFNRSESEFADLKFDFSSFANAQVRAKSSDEITQTVVRYSGKNTRAYSASQTLKPGSLGAASKFSVKRNIDAMPSDMTNTTGPSKPSGYAGTRAYSASQTLKPNKGINGMSISLSVFGLNSSVRVSGKITNLSAGISLHDMGPLDERLDQNVDEDHWTISLPADSTKPGSVSTTFGTFGVPIGGTRAYTRACADDSLIVGLDSLLQNMLELDFYLPDGDTVHYETDVTDVIKKEFERILEEENNPDPTPGPVDPDKPEGVIVVEVGDKNDTEGSNDSKTDGETSNGTLILHKTNAGTNVKVADWETTVIEIVL